MLMLSQNTLKTICFASLTVYIQGSMKMTSPKRSHKLVIIIFKKSKATWLNTISFFHYRTQMREKCIFAFIKVTNLAFLSTIFNRNHRYFHITIESLHISLNTFILMTISKLGISKLLHSLLYLFLFNALIEKYILVCHKLV